MKILLFILKNLGEYKKSFYAIAIVSAINSVAGFYIPVSLAEFANNPLSPGGFGLTVMIIIVLYVVSLFASYIVRGRGEALASNYANLIRLQYFRELAGLPIGQLRKKHSGYMQSLVNRVANGLSGIIFSLFWNLIPGVLLVVLFFVYMARQSVVLACANLAIMIVFVVISGLLARKMIPIAAEQNRRNATVLGGYADFMANITTVAQLGIRPFAHTILSKRVIKSNQQTDTLQQFHAKRWFLLHTLFGLAYLSTISFLVWQIAQGILAVGLLILFVSAYGMMRGLVEQLSENVKSFMEIRAYIQELEDFIGEFSSESRAPKKITWQTMTMKNVVFNYQKSNDTIRIPELAIKAKQKICIEGKSGQGKTTVLGLLTNSLRPQEGQRRVDGVSYESIGRAFFESQVAVISQEAELFHLSVRDNITLGRQINDTVVLNYLKELGMKEWFDSLDNGFDSIIGEKGVTLSAGQRQRLNILRGIVLGRSFYILDEPTSHLDTRTEELVVIFLRKYLADKTVVVVTHRPVLRDICEVSYEMKDHTLALRGASDR